jgi:hypothetical protein
MAARVRRIFVALAAGALVALALPEIAAACPMCLAGQGSGGTGRAFAIGSVFLSITPLAVIGGAVWYLRRRSRALAADAPPSPPVRPPA